MIQKRPLVLAGVALGSLLLGCVVLGVIGSLLRSPRSGGSAAVSPATATPILQTALAERTVQATPDRQLDLGNARARLLDAARIAWNSGNHDDALKKYAEFYRSWWSGAGEISPSDQQAFGDELPKYYSRFIEGCLTTYESNRGRYFGELKIAKEQLGYAEEIGIRLPDLRRRVDTLQTSADTAEKTSGEKLKRFEAIVDKLDEFPDRLAGRTERESFNASLAALIRSFEQAPFDATLQADEGKKIVERYEAKVQGRYSGQQFNLLEAEVADIIQALQNR